MFSFTQNPGILVLNSSKFSVVAVQKCQIQNKNCVYESHLCIFTIFFIIIVQSVTLFSMLNVFVYFMIGTIVWRSRATLWSKFTSTSATRAHYQPQNLAEIIQICLILDITLQKHPTTSTELYLVVYISAFTHLISSSNEFKGESLLE